MVTQTLILTTWYGYAIANAFVGQVCRFGSPSTGLEEWRVKRHVRWELKRRIWQNRPFDGYPEISIVRSRFFNIIRILRFPKIPRPQCIAKFGIPFPAKRGDLQVPRRAFILTNEDVAYFPIRLRGRVQPCAEVPELLKQHHQTASSQLFE